MTKKWQLQEFPLDEIAMLRKITSRFNNWKYIDMEQEDLIQEVLLKLLENKEEWFELRSKSTSSTLMYKALNNYACKVWDQQVKQQIPYDRDTISYTITEAMIVKEGRIYDFYLTMPEKSQRYIERVYSKDRSVSKKSVKEELNLTHSEMVIIEKNITNEARYYLKDTQGVWK